MSDAMVLLVLAAVVLLLVHRAAGELRRALVEYVLVAVLAAQLAATNGRRQGGAG